ncbi:MAG: hypothetical protein SOW78_11390 [Clostridia bacterium]|nr:hypothetical protein [Clostridia bacterium]
MNNKNHNQKNKISEKTQILERESNITLVSATIAILSFFVLLYIQTLVTTNVAEAQLPLAITEITYLVLAMAAAMISAFKRKKYLLEYTAFCVVMAIGYYLLKNGASGIPFVYKESANSITISPMGAKLAGILKTNYIIYALWGINVLYCILTISLHTVKYNKIKNSSAKSGKDK